MFIKKKFLNIIKIILHSIYYLAAFALSLVALLINISFLKVKPGFRY